MHDPSSLLESLVRARTTAAPFQLDAAQRPRDEAGAYTVAVSLIKRLGFSPNGYKIGANSAQGQQALGLAQPLFGRTFAERTQGSPAVFDTRNGMVAIEAEIAVRLAERWDGSLVSVPEDWRAVLADAVWAIEINQPSYADPIAAGGLAIIADNGVHAGLVLGEPIDPTRLADALRDTVALNIDSSAVHGSAMESGIDVLAAVDWLAHTRAASGQPLRAGEWIATGAVVSRAHRGAGRVTLSAAGRTVAELRLD